MATNRGHPLEPPLSPTPPSPSTSLPSNAAAPTTLQPTPNPGTTENGGAITTSATLGTIDFCLSGGGFRATLFHLGVIEYLARVRLLGHVERVFSASGGSISAAHLVRHWGDYVGTSASVERPMPSNDPPESDARKEHARLESAYRAAVEAGFTTRASGLVDFTRRDIRGGLGRGVLMWWTGVVFWLIAGLVLSVTAFGAWSILLAGWSVLGIVVKHITSSLRRPFWPSQAGGLVVTAWMVLGTLLLALAFRESKIDPFQTEMIGDFPVPHLAFGLLVLTIGPLLVLGSRRTLTERLSVRLRALFGSDGLRRLAPSDSTAGSSTAPRASPARSSHRPELHLLVTNVASKGGAPGSERRASSLSFDGFRRDVADESPVGCETLRIADAVAISAALPGFFPATRVKSPNISGEHPVLLIDGGVADNLGVRSALDRTPPPRNDTADSERWLVVSDASGRPGPEKTSWIPSAISTPLRASDAVMARVRELELDRISREGVRGYSRVFLIGPDYERFKRLFQSPSGAGSVIASFAQSPPVEPRVMEKVAALRTDLDPFHPIEIRALVYAGRESAADAIEQSRKRVSGSLESLFAPVSNTEVFPKTEVSWVKMSDPSDRRFPYVCADEAIAERVLDRGASRRLRFFSGEGPITALWFSIVLATIAFAWFGLLASSSYVRAMLGGVP